MFEPPFDFFFWVRFARTADSGPTATAFSVDTPHAGAGRSEHGKWALEKGIGYGWCNSSRHDGCWLQYFFFFPFFREKNPSNSQSQRGPPPARQIHRRALSRTSPYAVLKLRTALHPPTPILSLSLSVHSPSHSRRHGRRVNLPFAGRFHELPSMDFKSTAPKAQPPP